MHKLLYIIATRIHNAQLTYYRLKLYQNMYMSSFRVTVFISDCKLSTAILLIILPHTTRDGD